MARNPNADDLWSHALPYQVALKESYRSMTSLLLTDNHRLRKQNERLRAALRRARDQR